MYTETKQLTIEQIKSFQAGLAAGLFTLTIADDGKIVIFQRKFSPTTGQEVEQECVASIEKQCLLDDIADCEFRKAAIEGFMVAENL